MNNKKKIALIAAGIVTPVGIYFRKRIMRVFKDLSRESRRWVPRKLTDEELAYYELTPSKNEQFHLAVSREKNFNGELAGYEVVLLEGKTVLFSHLLTSPEITRVADNGVTAVLDRKQTDPPTEVFVYNRNGSTLFHKLSEKIPYELLMHPMGKVVVFVLRKGYSAKDTDFLVYLPDTGISHHFSLDFAPEEIRIGAGGKRIDLTDENRQERQYSFAGKWLNRQEYEEHLLQNGTMEEKLDYFLARLDQEVAPYLKSKAFENFLAELEGVAPEAGKLSRESAFLFRKIGEYHEEQNAYSEALRYYQLALDKYERVGVKTKVRTLQNKENE